MRTWLIPLLMFLFTEVTCNVFALILPTLRSTAVGFSPRAVLQACSPQQDPCTTVLGYLVITRLNLFPSFCSLGILLSVCSSTTQRLFPPRTFPWVRSSCISFITDSLKIEILLQEAASIFKNISM